MEELLKLQPDLLEYLDFHFYDRIKYYEPGSFPSDVEQLGKFVRSAQNIGSDL